MFQHLRALNQQSHLGAPAGPHQQGSGGGQPQSAGAGDNQHGHRRRECLGQPMAQHKSVNQQCGHRHQNHHRHKHLRNPVGKLLHRSFLRLRVTHQLRHLRQRGICPHPGGPHHQPARRIHGRPSDHAILRHLHWHRFAREHGLVHRRMALDHHAIGGDLLARLDDKHIPHRELADRNTVRGAVDKHGNILRAHVQQRPQCLGTAALCAGLKPPA